MLEHQDEGLIYGFYIRMCGFSLQGLSDTVVLVLSDLMRENWTGGKIQALVQFIDRY